MPRTRNYFFHMSDSDDMIVQSFWSEGFFVWRSDMANKRIWTDTELHAMPQSREKLEEYFTACATDAFKQASELNGDAKRKRLMFAMAVFQNLEALVESTYEGPK